MPDTKPLWIVRDKNGNPWGPFESTDAAYWFAYRKWPHPGTAADFEIVALRHPDE